MQFRGHSRSLEKVPFDHHIRLADVSLLLYKYSSILYVVELFDVKNIVTLKSRLEVT